MNRRRWRWGLAVLVLPVGLALGVALEHLRGVAALDRFTAGLVARGEKIRVTDLEPSPVPAASNAAIALLSLTNRLHEVASAVALAPPSRRVTAPGRAIVSHRLQAWFPERGVTATWARVQTSLESHQGLLQEIHEAARLPAYGSPVDYRKGFRDLQIPRLVTYKGLARLKSLAALNALNRGEADRAARELVDTVRLAVIESPEPLIILQLVRQAIADLGCSVTWEALEAGTLSGEALRELQETWERCDFISDFGRAMEMEQAMTLEFFDAVARSGPLLEAVAAQREANAEIGMGVFETFVTHGRVLTWVQLPLWRRAWAEQDCLASLKQWNQLLAQHRTGATQGWAAIGTDPSSRHSSWLPILDTPDDKAAPSWIQRFRLPFSSSSSFVSVEIVRNTLFAQTQQQMAIAAIAIERYRRAQGSLPPDLTALVPAFLAHPPRDPLGGGVLRYRTEGGSRFLLYSTGSDGHDDGGDGSGSPGAHSMTSLRDGKDVVWPTPAPTNEVAHVLQPRSR